MQKAFDFVAAWLQTLWTWGTAAWYGDSNPLRRPVTVGIWVIALVGIGCLFVGCRCSGGPRQEPELVFLIDHEQTCPVTGSSCSCGCRQGAQCNCAKPADIKPLTPAELQAIQYAIVAQWAKAHPDQIVRVYVNISPPPQPLDGTPAVCRYDAGWPNIKTPTLIQGGYRNGQFVEFGRFPLDASGNIIVPVGPPPRQVSFADFVSGRSC